MSSRRRRAVLAVAGPLVAGAMAAGCGSTPAASTAPPAAPPPLATSFTDGTGPGWVIVEMGGSAAQENNFWQLFTRTSGSAVWRLATPLGVADNGGLVVTGTGGTSLLTGFVPSQSLTFSPLAVSSDSGASWSSSSLVNPGLADVPDALASQPDGRLVALTRGGAELGRSPGTAWTHLSSSGALASTAAGKVCGVAGLTAVGFGTSGAPMLAASCDRPGVVGIFADSGGRWDAAGPAVPASLARENIEVLRLTAVGTGLVALLQAGTGPSASVIAAWYDDGKWTLSAPLRTLAVRSTAIGPGGSVGVIFNATHAATLAGPGASWHTLPPLPRWAAGLALGTAGQVDAIAAHGGTFTDWRPGHAGWSLAQTINVSIPYGSSG